MKTEKKNRMVVAWDWREGEMALYMSKGTVTFK